ncbi:hypothetical protein KIN20_005185 [Parelaphostrongylus tenuis]|uniref:Uncharacterized protein n=1 Tax=Parelaphostrongylus tenuis TaxID=148309 RepID=A0AAD5M459_PARTN|nr:hypothetical protein KIN20_005185 [Parelaphostrongylus tenuis]
MLGACGDMETAVKEGCDEEEEIMDQLPIQDEAMENESNENGMQLSTNESNKEQLEECADEELLSVASSDLAMADEAYECSDDENLDGLSEYVTEEVVRFDVDNFKPGPTKHIRPPWFKYPPADCDAKNWEIFMETLEAFDHDTILEGIDDFIVTIETLMPHLASCFTLVGKDGAVSDKEVSSRIIVWLEMCLSKDVQALEEMDKMYGVAFGIIKTVADSPNGTVIGENLIEFGLMELLFSALEESNSAMLRMGALYAIFQLISSPSLWRKANANLREVNSEDRQHSLYSRLVALSLGDRFFVSKEFLSLVTLTLSWSRFITSLIKFEAVADQLFSKICTSSSDDLPIASLSEGWNNFLVSLNAVREYIAEFDDEKICAGFDVYAVLQSSELLGICARLLRMSRVFDAWPNVLQFLQYLMDDKYYGTLFIAHSAELNSLYTELKMLADAEDSDQSSQLEGCDFYEEGFCEFEEKFATPKELYLTISYRLHVLQLLDELRGCAGSMRHDIDDEKRVSSLLSLCELSNDTDGIGRREVVWMLAQKYVYYLMDIIEHTASSRDLRTSAAFSLSVQLLETVLASVDDPKFWTRQAKAFSRLLSKRYITPKTPKLYEYLAPFSDTVLQNVGSPNSDVVLGIYKKMYPCMVSIVMVNSTVITYARMLEAAMSAPNYASLLQIHHFMELERVFDMLGQWLYELVQYRHALWQMGEPVSSTASKNFLSFAFPVLKIFAARFKISESLVGHRMKLGAISDNLLDALFLMWSCSCGMNGQKFTTECRKIRHAVLDVLAPSLSCQKSLALMIRHVLVRSCSRPHLFASALGFLSNLAPYAPPLFIPKTDISSWKDVVIRHRLRVDRFVNAFNAYETRFEIAEMLLAPSAYVFELSRAFVDRMSRLDFRLAQELVEILVKYIVESVESRLSNKYIDNAVTPAGSVTGEEMLKDNEKMRPASTGVVRLMESFMQLCQVHHFRTVLYYFLSRYPSRHRYLLPILSQFERPTHESERQSRYQSAVLELLSGLCSPSLWTSEFTTFDSDYCLTSDVESCVLNGADSPKPFATSNAQEEENGVDEPAEVINDEMEADDAAAGLELIEETDCDSQPSSSLEAIILSLCRFVNNPDQKISGVQSALEIMMNVTSDAVKEDNAPFLKVVSECLRRIGLLPLFERLNKSFNSEEVMTCLHAVTKMLDNSFGEKPNLLMEALDSSSDQLFASIISQIKDKPNIDASTNSVLKILDKYRQSFSSCPATNEAANDDVEVPVVYGSSVAVAKLYSGPSVTVVAKTSDSYRRIRAASSILIKRQETNKTRMGSEVAKIIETTRGKEINFPKLLQTQLEVQ